MTDILVRLGALETQLRLLTARSEEQANALSLMEQRLIVLERQTSVAAPAQEANPAPSPRPASDSTRARVDSVKVPVDSVQVPVDSLVAGTVSLR
jgi:hypothetical protein